MKKLNSKDLLGIKNLCPEEIELILETAKTMKNIVISNTKKAPHLQGKTILTLFYENSTRTRTSFELAGKYLSANVANIAVKSSSVEKGETLIDTGRTLDVMGTDVVIVRHSMSGAPELLAKNIKASVINAGDGMHEHPTQALLDMFTILEKKGTLSGLKVAIIGDILHSRVARSNILGLIKMGSEVSVGGPITLMPRNIEKLGVKVSSNIQQAVLGADVIINLRIQLERQKSAMFPTIREYSKFFGLNTNIIKECCNPDVLLMHPGPVNRGVEMTSEIIDGNQSAIDEQVTNGVAIRMALLYLLTRKESI